MTESSGRLDPLQSYPAITIPSFLWGNTQGRERKLDQNFTEESAGVAGERDETEHFLLLPKHLQIGPGTTCNAVFASGYAEFITTGIYSRCTVGNIG